MDERILEFIKNEQVLSWAMIDEKGVYTKTRGSKKALKSQNREEEQG